MLASTTSTPDRPGKKGILYPGRHTYTPESARPASYNGVKSPAERIGCPDTIEILGGFGMGTKEQALVSMCFLVQILISEKMEENG